MWPIWHAGRLSHQMKLHEYQSKELLARYGIAVPGGDVATNGSQARAIAEALGGRVVVKAQVLMGGRGKAGGVKLCSSASEAAAATEEMIGKRLVSKQNPTGMVVEKVLVAQMVDISEEYYLAALLDRETQRLVVMISARGGMDIEEVAEKEPEAIARLYVDPAWGLWDYDVRRALDAGSINPAARSQLVGMIKKLVKAYQESDAELIEINPCALMPDGKVIAADAKVAIDDNALYRHSDFIKTREASVEDALEAEASTRGIAYVRLGGDIGIIGNGAGLVMCSMDEVQAAGGRPANFLDVGGGAQAERVKSCVELVLMDSNVKGLLINIFGGITRGDEVAKGIISAFDELEVKVPVVARVEGTASEGARELLRGTKLVPAETMQEAAQKVVELAYAG